LRESCFTAQPLVRLLWAEALAAGLDRRVYTGDFDTSTQELLDFSGPLYGFHLEAVLLALRTPDVIAELWRDAATAGPGAVVRTLEQHTGLVEAPRERTPANGGAPGLGKRAARCRSLRGSFWLPRRVWRGCSNPGWRCPDSPVKE
jgi:hypothetical protein